ncbi:MAG TPA: hypothetical protein VJC21_04145 [Candidatus Nanoarchaeia archaeon]|nr:hypothetical protein [Candidatus Nanoarchaeia archaeon]
MFSPTDFQEYYQKTVIVLVDGRGYNWYGGEGREKSVERADRLHHIQICASPGSETLELRGRLVGESVQFLTLDDVAAINHPPVSEEDQGLTKLTRGTINKDYIIGIFEDRTE